MWVRGEEDSVRGVAVEEGNTMILGVESFRGIIPDLCVSSKEQFEWIVRLLE